MHLPSYFLITFLLTSLFAISQTEIDSIDKYLNLDAVEIVIKENPLTTVKDQEYSLRLKSLDRLPQFLGSTDPIRTFQLLPGIQTTGDISGGLFVEGCNPSHNLILLDDAPVYNPTHLGGFFSVFNSDHLESFNFNKDYISPIYGGRLGGALYANSIKTIPNETKTDANISLLVSNATTLIPLSKKSMLSISGRISYLNPILNLINSIQEQKSSINYSFYDINVGYLYKSKNDEWKINFYSGKDEMNVTQDNFQINGEIDWRNLIGSTNWNHKFNSKDFLSQTLYYSSFGDNLSISLNSSNITFISNIQEIGYKNCYSKQIENINFKIGLDYNRRFFIPQYLDYSDLGNAQKEEAENYSEMGAFIEANFNLTKKLSTQLGFRQSLYLYKDSLSKTANYTNPEPRLNLKYKHNNTFSTNITIQQQVQYINQVMTSAIGFPSNFWVATNENIPYQKSQSIALSANKKTRNLNYEFVSSIFYKKLYNQFESSGYITDLFLGSIDIQNRYNTGDGDNYGTEILIKKNSGDLTGWLSYTLSWSWRNFDNINAGNQVPSITDRRHDFNLVANYNLSSKWDFSACFILASGVPATFSEGIYIIGEMAVNQYPDYNSNRLPWYHRLDISATRNLKIKYFKTSKLNFSIYNVYGRKNPFLFSTALLYDEANGRVKIQRHSHSLYSIMPSIGLKIGF